MPVRWLRDTPKGILVIAASWFTLSACFIWFFVGVYALEGTTRSLELTSNINDASWEWNMLIVLMAYAPAVMSWLAFMGGPILLGVGLLRKKQTAASAARHLSLFWVLLVIAGFAVSLADRYSRTDLKDWFFVAVVITYNLWSWWYLSRPHVQEKLNQEPVLLNLRSA